MGRFKKLLQRNVRSRALRGDVKGVARGRTLAFEQCESRLALSATSATVDSIDGAALSQWWIQSSGSIDWSQAIAERITASRQPGVADSYRRSLAAATSNEGGTILLGVASKDYALDGGAKAATDHLVESAFSYQLSGIPDGVMVRGVVTGQSPWSQFRLSDSNIVIEPAHPQYGYGGQLDGDIGTTSELFNGGTGGVILSASSFPVLRITTPIVEGSAEGGAIDLTAMAGPTRPLSAKSASSFDAANEGARIASISTAARASAARQSLSIEGLRARAVVYEVADFHARREGATDSTLDETPATGAKAPLEPAGTRNTRGSDKSARSSNAAEQSHRLGLKDEQSAPAVDANQPGAADEAAPAEQSASAAVHSADQAASDGSETTSAAAHDAALGDWSNGADRLLRESQAEAAELSLAVSQRQKAGLAVAVVIGAGPLIKRARRAKSRPEVERPSGQI